MTRRIVSLAVLMLVARPLAAQPVDPATPDVRFVVLGHVRGGEEGGLNPRLGELLAEVRALEPSFVVLTGDIVWGDYNNVPHDLARVRREWEEIDEALRVLEVPVYRVPGNHDISDVGTRDIWFERYGELPRAVEVAGLRLLLLSSTFIPPDGDTSTGGRARGVDLDARQIQWLEAELGRPSPAPTFVFLHHLLWWEAADEPWWTGVHPLLVGAGVRAVFSGDYGPLKFSTTERDGLRYYQTSIEGPVSLRMLQLNIPSRVLSAQFDNYLAVTVRGETVDVEVRTVAEVSSGEFTPDRYYSIIQGPPPPLLDRLRDFVGSRNRIAALLLGFSFAFGAGWWIGRHRR